MKKFNGMEAYWIEEGLKLVLAKGIKEIEKAEEGGKNHLMTTGYMSQEITNLRAKLAEMTLKKK